MVSVSNLRVVAEAPGVYPRCTPGTVGVPVRVRYVGHQDLPDVPWAHGLSGLHWTGAGLRFDAVQDNAWRGMGPYLIELTTDDTLLHWTGRLRTDLSVRPYDGLEAVTRWGGGLLVSTDGDDTEGVPIEPHIVTPMLGQPARVTVSVPSVMRVLSANSGIEAMSVTPDGLTLYFGTERPRRVGGVCEGFVRIARVRETEPVRLYRYELSREGSGRDVGLDEMVALGDDWLLTLERGYTEGVGSAVRIYATHLWTATQPGSPEGTTDKTLVADLVTLPREGFVTLLSTGQRVHPALGNYEGMSLGPCLSDGSRAMVLVTDDNWDGDTAPPGRRVLGRAVTW